MFHHKYKDNISFKHMWNIKEPHFEPLCVCVFSNSSGTEDKGYGELPDMGIENSARVL